MNQFLYWLWKERLQYRLSGEMGVPALDKPNLQKLLLFDRQSSRSSDSVTFDYIHGHAKYFKEFAKAIGECRSPTCDYCEGYYTDSPFHRLFECSRYISQERDTLVGKLTNISNYKYEIVFSRDKELINAFKDMIARIEDPCHNA